MRQIWTRYYPDILLKVQRQDGELIKVFNHLFTRPIPQNYKKCVSIASVKFQNE